MLYGHNPADKIISFVLSFCPIFYPYLCLSVCNFLKSYCNYITDSVIIKIHIMNICHNLELYYSEVKGGFFHDT